jgi:chromosome transmission fidelity protein 1
LRGVYAPSSKKGGKKKGGCPFYDDLKRLDLRDTILAEVQDIEEVVAQGKATSACPYYASRAAVKSSELVCVPYTSLVHKGTREALGVSLEGNVVVIDEAHNLIDAVNEVHSASLTQASAKVLIKLFQGYLDKFLTRLSPANVVRLKQVVWVLKSFEGLMSKASSAAPEPANVDSQKKQQTAQAAAAATETAADKLDEGDADKIKARVGSVLSVAEFCVATKIDNINLFDLLRYFEKSKILPKLHGYYERMQMTEGSGEETGGLVDGQVSVVQPFQTFLRCLTDQEDDGRITLHRDESSGALRMSYQLLNAATHFSDIVSKAHAVVLVGGTMKPMEDFAQQLFPTVSVDRLMTLSVDHVISDSSILPLTLSEGPTGQVFDFRHESRGSDRWVLSLNFSLGHVFGGSIFCACACTAPEAHAT